MVWSGIGQEDETVENCFMQLGGLITGAEPGR
jgi:hypothetical protein